KRLSAVRWGVAGNILVAWILTLPGAAVIGGLTYLVTRAFGTGAVGPIVVWDALLQVIWVSLLAGVAVPAAWGFALLGSTRALEYGREGRAAAAVSYAIVGVAGVAVVLGAIVFGILILTGD